MVIPEEQQWREHNDPCAIPQPPGQPDRWVLGPLCETAATQGRDANRRAHDRAYRTGQEYKEEKLFSLVDGRPPARKPAHKDSAEERLRRVADPDEQRRHQ